MKPIIYSSLILMLLFSCKGEKTQTVVDGANAAVSATEDMAKKAMSEVVGSVEIPAMYKGMAEDPKNVLGGLSVGDKVENFSAKTHQGKNFELNTALQRGPVLFMFYRGHWCPKCTKHLAEWENYLLELKEYDISIYAITPETEENIAKTVEKSSSSFPIIYDKDQSIMENFKVLYKVRDDYVPNLEKNHGQDEAFLPVPATYLIGEGGKILYSHYDHDYGNRASIQEVLAVLENY